MSDASFDWYNCIGIGLLIFAVGFFLIFVICMDSFLAFGIAAIAALVLGIIAGLAFDEPDDSKQFNQRDSRSTDDATPDINTPIEAVSGYTVLPSSITSPKLKDADTALSTSHLNAIISKTEKATGLKILSDISYEVIDLTNMFWIDGYNFKNPVYIAEKLLKANYRLGIKLSVSNNEAHEKALLHLNIAKTILWRPLYNVKRNYKNIEKDLNKNIDELKRSLKKSLAIYTIVEHPISTVTPIYTLEEVGKYAECPYCGSKIRETFYELGGIIRCNNCGAFHHKECFEYYGGKCGSSSCKLRNS